jgi:hypothetical protein
VTSLKQSAELIWCLLVVDLITVEHVVQWADWLILRADEPPYWVIELSLSRNKDAALEVLKNAPGTCSEPQLSDDLHALFARRWIQRSHTDARKTIARTLGGIAAMRGVDYGGPMRTWLSTHWEIEDMEDIGQEPRWGEIMARLEQQLLPYRAAPMPDLGPLNSALVEGAERR